MGRMNSNQVKNSQYNLSVGKFYKGIRQSDVAEYAWGGPGHGRTL